MKTSDQNTKIHYDGQAVAWQGANRIWADTIDIDREARRLGVTRQSIIKVWIAERLERAA